MPLIPFKGKMARLGKDFAILFPSLFPSFPPVKILFD